MMTTVRSYVKQGKGIVHGWLVDPKIHMGLRFAGYCAAGLLLSAASLVNRPQPLVLGLISALSGWQAALVCLGGCVGYLAFWGAAGLQGILWSAAGLAGALILGQRKLQQQTPLLMAALSGLIVAASGVVFQYWLGDETGVGIYLLRVGLGAASTKLFQLALGPRDAIARWLCCGLSVLALGQVAPLHWLNFGFLAAGALCAAAPFPAAAMAGLALDLGQVSPVPMTAAVCLGYTLRLLPRSPKWAAFSGAGLGYLGVSMLSGAWNFIALPALVLGGWLGSIPKWNIRPGAHRGPTGVAQVRLEMAATVFSQTEQLLLEAPTPPIDEDAIVQRAAERACAACPCRRSCKEREQALKLPGSLLHRPLLDEHDLPLSCRKTGRLLTELHRAQEQLRAIRADRERQKEYRAAVQQQYQFLGIFLQELADELTDRADRRLRYSVDVQVVANRPEADNGDRVAWFSGTLGRYYIVLCDGMGKGLGAADEGKTALSMLKRLLSAGYPAEHALRSLNSLCALRGRAGAVTADIAEICLDTGRAALYKWGAAPSCLLEKSSIRTLGTPTPPPGISVDSREQTERFTMRRGEVLILLSDGIDAQAALKNGLSSDAPLTQIGKTLLRRGEGQTDDATAALIRLSPAKNER